MNKPNNSQEVLIGLLKDKLSDTSGDLLIPPPVFEAMGGEVLALDMVEKELKIKFPVKYEYLNPFGNMQGGMIAAVIDNTLGPLSMAAGPLNYTRHFEVKYIKTIPHETECIFVIGKLIEKKRRQLFFTASVTDEAGVVFAQAKSIHWIVSKD